MRLALAMLLGSCVASAKPKSKAPEPAPAPKPSWAAEEDPSQDADPCPTTPPFGWRLEVGWANGRTEAEAKSQAMARARKQLLDKACGGASELRCASIARHVAPWKSGTWDKKEKSACQAMAIEAKVLEEFDAEITRVDADIARLATAVMAANGTKLLEVIPPTWASGCVAGDLGATLAARMRNQMAKSASARLVPPGRKNPTANLFKVTLTPSADKVTLTAALYRADQEVAKQLPGFDFRLDVFNIDPSEAGECRSDADMGLADGEHLGKDGLRAWVDVPSRDGLICEGASVEPKLRVSRPSKVQVYSVARDGKAFMVWPPPGELGIIESEMGLGQNQMISMPDHGDETLIAVAVDKDGTFGQTAGWTGFCRLGGAFGPMSYPAEAAVATERYQVLPNGARGCPEIPPIDKTALEQALAQAPVCGG
jgi:hypothetical protein